MGHRTGHCCFVMKFTPQKLLPEMKKSRVQILLLDLKRVKIAQNSLKPNKFDSQFIQWVKGLVIGFISFRYL